MRLSNAQAVARPDFFDRNPLQISRAYAVGLVAPHGATVRWTYTVPANRKARIELSWARVYRDAAATAAGVASIFITVTPNGGVATYICESLIDTNTIGAFNAFGVGVSATMGPADVVTATSIDASTAGTHSLVATIKAIEADS